MRIKALLDNLEAQEQAFLARDILAPVLRGRAVGVQIAGVRCSLQLDRRRYEGWAVLRPLSAGRARILRPARMGEVASYLALFPPVRLIALARSEGLWQAVAAQQGARGLRLARPVPVVLAEEELQPFDPFVARFDGRLFLYARRDERRDPAIAAYLRQALAADQPPQYLRKSGLSPEERAAYDLVWLALEQARRDHVEVRLAEALAHAGARLVAYIERDELYTVTYEVDGVPHTSALRKDNLTVLTAGICLSDRDDDFDLTSLVGVMREYHGD
jgi:hypothetical protein